MKKPTTSPRRTNPAQTDRQVRQLTDRDLATTTGGSDGRSYVTGYFALDLDGVR